MVAYKYSFPIAWFRGSGPNAPINKAANASILIYAPTDTGFTTPLTAYADKELTTIQNIVTDSDGVGADFYVDNLPDIVWVSGVNKGDWATSQSRPGLRGPVSTVPGPPGNPGTPGTPGLNGINGDVTKWVTGAAYAVGDSLLNPSGDLVTVITAHTSGGSYEPAKFSTPYDSAVSALVSTDTSAARAALDSTYGPEAQVESATLQDAFGQPTYSTSAWTPGSKIYPLATDPTRIFGLGSSSMGNMGPEISAAIAEQDLWGAAYTSMAHAGERFEHALARAGIIPAKLTFPSNTIPASGAVTVTCDLPTTYFLRAYTGTVGGVTGTLSLVTGVFTFTRTTAGSAVATTAGVEFVPNPAKADATPELPSFRDAVAILDIGKNNENDAGAADRINAALDLVVTWLVPKVTKFVVLGHFVDTNSTLTQKQNIAKVNAYRAATYGTLFMDLQAYVTGSGIWADTGITPTATDLNQQANGEKPGSLSSDDLHLNPTAEQAVVDNLIMPKLAEALGRVIYGPNPIIASDAFTGSDVTTISGRITDSTLGGEASTWTASANFAISGGQVTTGTATGILALPVTTPDVEFSIKVDTKPTTNSLTVQVRMKQTAASSTNDAYRATLTAAGAVTLVRRFGGADATISTGTHIIAAGGTLGVRAVGNQISLMINGVAVETVTDSNITNGPWAGVGTVSTTGAILDDAKLRSITDPGEL